MSTETIQDGKGKVVGRDVTFDGSTTVRLPAFFMLDQTVADGDDAWYMAARAVRAGNAWAPAGVIWNRYRTGSFGNGRGVLRGLITDARPLQLAEGLVHDDIGVVKYEEEEDGCVELLAYVTDSFAVELAITPNS